jgi:glutamyl-Q tRNA(Asp) synthetase
VPSAEPSTAARCVTRFAPSPTGPLHLGHAYSAILAHDFARERGGVFRLRIEDIDPGRVRAEHIDGITEDLGWLGLEWDLEMTFQSERLHVYAEALDRLKADALLYPCFCTRADIAAEIAASASAPHGPEGHPYPGTCRALPAQERQRLLAEKPHAWRLDMKAALRLFPGEGRGPVSPEPLDPGLRRGTLTWLEGDHEIIATPLQFGDVVLARKDAPASYHLAVTIDDAAQVVTDVVRGRDLFETTHVHRLLQALLDLPSPTYHHHALIADAQGRRLAKRHGAPTIASLRAAGANPAALLESLRAGRLPAGYSTAAT